MLVSHTVWISTSLSRSAWECKKDNLAMKTVCASSPLNSTCTLLMILLSSTNGAAINELNHTLRVFLWTALMLQGTLKMNMNDMVPIKALCIFWTETWFDEYIFRFPSLMDFSFFVAAAWESSVYPHRPRLLRVICVVLNNKKYLSPLRKKQGEQSVLSFTWQLLQNQRIENKGQRIQIDNWE